MSEQDPHSNDARPERDPLWVKAYESLTRRLGARDHSEKELRDKLIVRFPMELVEEMIALAKKNNWLADPQVLAARTTERLAAKGKGSLYIAQHLKKIGLPLVSVDRDRELEFARELAARKFGDITKLKFEQKPKVMRFLVSRGYNRDIVNQVIFETPTREPS